MMKEVPGLDGDFCPNPYKYDPCYIEHNENTGDIHSRHTVTTPMETPRGRAVSMQPEKEPSLCCCVMCSHVPVCKLSESYVAMYDSVINQQMNQDVAEAFTVSITCKFFKSGGNL